VKLDNLGYDPMDEYRKELSRNDANPDKHQAGPSHQHFEPFDSKQAGNPWILPASTKMSEPRHDNDPLDLERPPPDYGDVMDGDNDTAPLY
jgi:hypothetical protein